MYFPSRTYWRVGLGERTFNCKVYQILPFYCGTWMILQSELAKLYSPSDQSSRIIWLMKHLLQWLISLDNDHPSLKIMSKLSTSDDQSVSKFFQIRIPRLYISKGMTHIVDQILSTPIHELEWLQLPRNSLLNTNTRAPKVLVSSTKELKIGTSLFPEMHLHNSKSIGKFFHSFAPSRCQKRQTTFY